MALPRSFAAEEGWASHGIAAFRIQSYGVQKEWTKKGRSSIMKEALINSVLPWKSDF